MGQAALRRALRATYLQQVDGFRPLLRGGEEPICAARPCALSRSAHVSAPTPPDKSPPLAETAYRVTLFTEPEVLFHLGDRLEITDGARVYHAIASDSFCYPSHTVTVVEVVQVEAVGQASREAQREAEE